MQSGYDRIECKTASDGRGSESMDNATALAREVWTYFLAAVPHFLFSRCDYRVGSGSSAVWVDNDRHGGWRFSLLTLLRDDDGR
jgi:hypothetical protein